MPSRISEQLVGQVVQALDDLDALAGNLRRSDDRIEIDRQLATALATLADRIAYTIWDSIKVDYGIAGVADMDRFRSVVDAMRNCLDLVVESE